MQAPRTTTIAPSNSRLETKVLATVAFLFLLAVAVSAALFLNLETRDDDAAYIAVGKTFGAWTASLHSYQVWSGRIALNYLLFSAIVTSWAWKLAMVASLLLLAFSMGRLGAGKAMPWISASALALALLLLLTDRRVQFDGMWWVTGSFNYLVPVALGLFAVSVLLNAQEAGPLERACGLLAAAIAAYQEQMAVSLSVAALGMLAFQVWQRSTRTEARAAPAGNTHFAKLFAFIVILNTAFQLLAPGNQFRFDKETETWFPEFADLSVGYKLFLGVERLAAHLVALETRAFHALLLVAGVMAWQRRRAWGWPAWSALAILAAHACFTLVRRSSLGEYFPYPAQVIPHIHNGLDISWFAMVWVLLAMGVMLGIRLAMAASLRERLLAALPWAVAAGSVVMVGLSPTVYASGWRVLYVADVMLVIALLDMLRKAGWLSGRLGTVLTGLAIVAAAWRVGKYGAAFFLRG